MGKLLRLLILAAAGYALYTRLRGADHPTAEPARRPPPATLPDDDADDLYDEAGDEEPVLGYEGMDTATLIPWLESAELDTATLRRVRAYEQRNRARQPVLETIDDLLR